MLFFAWFASRLRSSLCGLAFGVFIALRAGQSPDGWEDMLDAWRAIVMIYLWRRAMKAEGARNGKAGGGMNPKGGGGTDKSGGA